MNFSTQAIRQGIQASSNREHSTALYLNSSFTFNSPEHAQQLFNGEDQGMIYSRFTNPNTDEFIQKLTALEKAENGLATASGMAAVTVTLFGLLQAGDHVVYARELFGNSSYLFSDLLPRFGVESTEVIGTDIASWEQAIRPNTKLLFAESPANPTLNILDIRSLSNLAHANNSLLVIDNCFATPYNQNPLVLGADLVLHSATKYIDGQGRVLGGAILGREELIQPCYEYHRRSGASLSPFNAWVLSKSLETLEVRMERHAQNAQRLFDFLKTHPKVSSCSYPFDPAAEHYELAKSQMRTGGGLVLANFNATEQQCFDLMRSLKLFSLTANLGDTRSIVTHPASTTHSRLEESAAQEKGIFLGTIRFSLGLEDADDIVNDVERAIEQAL